ncbi:hypothetical protein GCM10019016_083430 [Streptomyces prasinosporus]|uniref:Uncharacterized protein n=1 Tax=Streptomyces prasinosporus TaxID=68256 RepID=A0ABP6U4L3_9ACTN
MPPCFSRPVPVPEACGALPSPSFLPSSSPTTYVPVAARRRPAAPRAAGLVLVGLGAGRLLALVLLRVLLLLLFLLHRAARHPPGVRQQRPRLLGVRAAEGAAVVGVGGLTGQRQVAADRLGGQTERLQHRLGQLPAVQGAGHGTADPLVGEGAVGAVEGELGVGRLQ